MAIDFNGYEVVGMYIQSKKYANFLNKTCVLFKIIVKS